MKKSKIDELYFGITMLDWNTDKIVHRNLFDLADIRRSVAKWATLSENEKMVQGYNPLSFCFGGVRGRAEYEMIVHDLNISCRMNHKVDIYQMFVIPNQVQLLDLVLDITPREGRKWLKANDHTRK